MDLMDFLLFKETSYIIKIHSENLDQKTAKCITCANEFIDTMNTIVVSFCEVYDSLIRGKPYEYVQHL